jgi:alpha-mannosidase
MQRMVFGIKHAGGLPQQALLDARLSVTLIDGLDRVDFRMHADWDAHSTRVRIAFPLALSGNAVYGVPYGQMVRPEYAPTFGWTGANGDWPAIDWAGVEGDGLSVALFNRGLPSYCTETAESGERTLLLSVLRSPTDGTYLHEPQFYSMPEYLGMRDAGHHDLEFALSAYAGPLSSSSVVDEATAYNAPLIAIPGRVAPLDAPRARSDCARVSAIKSPEDGAGLVVRAWEYRGRGGNLALDVPSWCTSVERSDLVEKTSVAVPLSGRSVRIALRPFEITTLILRG